MSPLRTATAFAAELWQAARRLSWSPAFAALAISILGVGIGTNAALVALLDALLFRPPFHVAEPGHVVRVQLRAQGEPSLLPRTHYPNFTDLRSSGAFAAVAAYADASVSVGAGRDATLANALLVSHEFFQVLRPAPHLGSFPAGDSTQSDGGDWAIVSYGFWLRQFGGGSDAVGARVTIDGRAYSVLGVGPNGFPSLSERRVDVWLPLDHTPVAGSIPRKWREDRERSWLSIVGRLTGGTSRSVAEQRATAVLRSRHVAVRDTESHSEVVATSIVPGRDGGESLVNKVSFWLAGVSAFLLLIACANVSNLVMTRALSQRREHFIRLALGASRWNLVLRNLADTCVIVIPGALGALAVSFLLRNAIAGFLPGDVPVSRQLWDVRTAGIMIGSASLPFLSIAAVSLLGVRAAASDGGSLLHATNARYVNMRTRHVLLAVQSGLCLALLSVAALFAMSLRRVESLDLGAQLDHTIQVTINLGPRHRTPGETLAIYERALDILSKHPGVERAALAERSPYMSGRGIGPRTADRSFEQLWPQRKEVAYQSVVGAGFFSTVGSQSLRGRDFSDADRSGAPLIAIINAPLARHLWPSEDAIGQCMWLDNAPTCVRVVGVLGGVWKFKALERDRMAVYLPLAQVADVLPGALYIRPKGDARTFLPQALSIVQSIRPDLPAARAVVLRDVVDPEFKPWRVGTTVFSAFAGVALLITSIGLYGLVAASAMLRLREIGIRMALGARRPQVIKVIVGESITSVAMGLVGGLVLVVAASSWLSGVLFQTSPRDPVILIETAVVLFIVAALAVTVPTLRALRTNPANVLRLE